VLLDDDDAHPVGKREFDRLGSGRLNRRGRGGGRDPLGGAGGRDDLDVGWGDELLRDDRRRDRDRIALRAVRAFRGEIVDRRGAIVLEVFARNALDIGGGDAVDRGELPVGGVRVAIDDRCLRDRAALALGGFAAEQFGGDDLVLRLGEFRRADRGVGRPCRPP
jgi:hypothetical protein